MGRPSTAKERLLSTASREFAGRGAQAVGVDELCRLAGINKGSFYHFFPSKTDLLLACLNFAWERVRSEVLEPAFAPDRTPEERIQAYFDLSVQKLEEGRREHGRYSGCIFTNLGNEMAPLEPSIQAFVDDYIGRNLAYLTFGLQGPESTSQPSEELAQAIYTLFLGSILQTRIQQSTDPILKARETALGLIRRAS